MQRNKQTSLEYSIILFIAIYGSIMEQELVLLYKLLAGVKTAFEVKN